MPIPGVRICGARCRSKEGGPCMQPAIRQSTRCKMHGGYTYKLKTHGRTTKIAKAERKELRALLKEMKIMNLAMQANNE